MLFKDTADIRRIIPRISNVYKFEDLEPFITLSEEKHIIPIIGQDFYDELNDAYASSPTAEELAAIKKLQFSLGYFTLLEAMPHLGLQIGSAGVGIGTSQTTQQVPQWKEFQLTSSLASDGEQFLDMALEFLEKNKGDYPTWVTSEEYTVSKELYINNAKDLNSKIPIFGSRRAYIKLRPFISQVQEDSIISSIGQDLHDDLITKILNDSLNSDEKALVKLIQKPLANIAAREAFYQIAFQNTGRGFRILSDNDSIIQKLAVKPEDLEPMLAKFASTGETAMIALKKFLNDNADAWPLYKNSDAYVQPNDSKPWDLPNNEGKRSFTV